MQTAYCVGIVYREVLDSVTGGDDEVSAVVVVTEVSEDGEVTEGGTVDGVIVGFAGVLDCRSHRFVFALK